jgi:pyruvate-formate lyase-activating enzyme
LLDGQIGKLSPIGSLVMTFGCKFSCAYCPIPAYNQRQHRVKSGAPASPRK